MRTESKVEAPDVDVVVVGAGMAGLYMLHRLRKAGLSAVVLEAADDVGGTWYWNRYPGARCDIQSLDYQYSFDPELEAEWQWTEKYATQPEILRYLQHVADRYDLRSDIRFSTRVTGARWDDGAALWRILTRHANEESGAEKTGETGDEDAGGELTCRFYVMATGCLSMPKEPEIEGAGRFAGEVYVTGRWPHEGVDFTGKRVAVIGTGSSGIQSIPLIAQQAKELVVFQRTANFSMPAGNGPIPEDKRAALEAGRFAYREAARLSQAGVPVAVPTEGALAVSDEERMARYEVAWSKGELLAPGEQFSDLITNAAANDTFAEFVRSKIRAVVEDPQTAELLCPCTHAFGTKRPCLDSGYFETFNLPHVRLIDLRATPISAITEDGIRFGGETLEVDAIVWATGFDAMTGALVGVDIQGRDGVTLAEKWAEGPTTYLGLTTVGFPNLFMITGPGSPSVLSNMVVSIEQHVDWIADCLVHLRESGFATIEPTETAESAWGRHVDDCAAITLFPRASSWYMGANVPGKPRVFLPYIGGVGPYRETCDRVVAEGYLGFRFSGPASEQCHDGVINRLQPDVALLLQMIAQLDIPRMETLSVAGARALSESLAEGRPPGPEVGEVADGSLPGVAGKLSYRLYRPASAGPHPVVCYFHGGGWVLGAQDSDDPFCRDLCVRSDAIVVSVDYRHAPESRFPAAADDAFAAARWIAEQASELGGLQDRLVLAGWSAGGNLAAVACQRARDEGGPAIAGQLLIAPVLDCDLTRASYRENADGYVLTTPLMEWFWSHYADEAERTDPMASPLRASTLEGLPPAAIFTCELDPLRDEGVAYAEALAAAGVDVEHHPCRGHIHTSLMAVDLILSGARIRARMANAVRRFSQAFVEAQEPAAGVASG
ncbi:MAG TPA: alpha/beta hydrolase fold domain-containing protein [Thermoanaerobaculia bacterium]|nr:alpha/beta hydrolase fold domain-containing protein [Thermoanaerobaculia bacterium]